MRRLLVPALLLPLAVALAPAAADPCDPEDGGCHPADCMAWEPDRTAPEALERLRDGDLTGVELLLPPPCPA